MAIIKIISSDLEKGVKVKTIDIENVEVHVHGDYDNGGHCDND